MHCTLLNIYPFFTIFIDVRSFHILILDCMLRPDDDCEWVKLIWLEKTIDRAVTNALHIADFMFVDAAIVMCNQKSVQYEYEGIILSPEANNETKRNILSCELQITGLPANSWIGFYVNSLNLRLGCNCHDDRKNFQHCAYIIIITSNDAASFCRDSNKKEQSFYMPDNGFIKIMFTSTNFASGHNFNLTYQGKCFKSNKLTLCKL